MKNNPAFFFQNTACPYFPCHEKADADSFNCLFCYCPLYMLGDACGGNFHILENGIKDCSSCLIPHSPHAQEYIASKFPLIAAAEQKNRGNIG